MSREMQPTTADAIEKTIRKFLMEKFALARKIGIDGETALVETGILDSLGILDVVSFLEAEFGITIADEDLAPENFQSVNALTLFVQRKSGLSV